MCKQTLIANIRVAAFWTLLAAPQWVFAEEPLQLAATVQWMGQIESRRLDESSGLAASQHYEDILWSINDSGSDAELFALTIRGEHVGRWSINLPTPSDWEAMDSFQWRGKNYLLLADIGDNFATRGSVSYTILAEPDARTLKNDAVLQPLITQHFVYPNGPRDSEAIAVDTERGEILVLSKRTKPPELYRLPLSFVAANESPSQHSASEAITATYVTSLRGFVAPTRAEVDLYGGFWEYLVMPTGMSIANDRLLVTTPEHAYLFDRTNLAQPPIRIMLPFAGQREAIAFAKDRSDRAYVSHERRYGLRAADIYRVSITPVIADPLPSSETR